LGTPVIIVGAMAAHPAFASMASLRSGRHAASGPGLVRVLFANNYDMARARAGWRAGSYPSHHLFGTARLAAPFEVVDLPYSRDDLAASLTAHARGRLGDIGQQLAAMRMRTGSSIVYGAAAHELRALAALRAARLFPAPIVGVFHGVRGRFTRSMLLGFDRAIAMSRYTHQQLLDGGMPPERAVALGWGADLSFPGFAPTDTPTAPDAPVVATGKTGRDMATLLAALRATGLPARIYADREQLLRTGAIPANVEVLPVSDERRPPSAPLTYDHTIADLRAAALVAIPLAHPHPYQGLTEVVDALACARPMIVTRTPYFDFDVEEIGCGWWVELGDVRGWSERLQAATADRKRLHEMGLAGRAWAAEHFNAQLFAEGVREVLLQVADGIRSPRQ
jgi:glycosyltransferase involved in cell wall biosynthesis